MFYLSPYKRYRFERFVNDDEKTELIKSFWNLIVLKKFRTKVSFSKRFTIFFLEKKKKFFNKKEQNPLKNFKNKNIFQLSKIPLCQKTLFSVKIKSHSFLQIRCLRNHKNRPNKQNFIRVY